MERVIDSNGAHSATYWYYKDGDRKVDHGPFLSYHLNSSRLHRISAFADGVRTSGSFRFRHNGSLWMAQVVLAPDRYIEFTYSLEGEELSQAIFVNGEPCCGTLADFQLRQNGISIVIDTFHQGKPVGRTSHRGASDQKAPAREERRNSQPDP